MTDKEERGTTLIEDNPLVDVAAYLFLEDIADKQGAAGMNTYLMSLATSLAKSMPEEEYNTWDDFLDALRKGESIMSSFEVVKTRTENCMVTQECPFARGWMEYTQRIGSFSNVHYDVAEYYNSNVKPGAINTCCIIHQTFRNAAAERIKVGGKTVKCAQISAISCADFPPSLCPSTRGRLRRLAHRPFPSMITAIWRGNFAKSSWSRSFSSSLPGSIISSRFSRIRQL